MRNIMYEIEFKNFIISTCLLEDALSLHFRNTGMNFFEIFQGNWHYKFIN